MLEIGNRSLIEHQLHALQNVGVKEVIIVVGYRKEMIQKKLGYLFLNIRVMYIENPIYRETNTMYSLWLARNYFKKHDFIFLNADLLFHVDVLKRLVDSKYDTCLAVDKKVCGEEEVKVITDSNSLIRHIGKELPLDRAEGEFIGVAKFGRSDNKTFIEKLDRCIRDGRGNEFFELAIQEMIGESRIYEVDVSDLPSIEIDFPEDLKIARDEVYLKILRMSKF
tara:strand:+ start:845 stop:1513 length:669 start_codon:yes stop_codon:yes gene_type:complete